MIPRYTRDAMATIWSDQRKWEIMLRVEIFACEYYNKAGKISASDLKNIKTKAKINVARINAIEKVVKHDVIAFLTQVGEVVGKSSRFIHMGLTSSDVLDTALAVQMNEACTQILTGLTELKKSTARLAKKYRNTIMMGRTHGIHAEPITFGLKALSWHSEILRDIEMLKQTKVDISYGKISGAVGTYAHIDPAIEAYICKKLGLKVEPVSTQIIPRDRHARYFSSLAVIAGTLERIATEIRHLQRTEVGEAYEPFTKGQKGSSAMPHKRNPILSENICGLARLVRSYAMVGFENIALWHERDISHSSAERVALPDASIAVDFMMARLNGMLANLDVRPEQMRNNMALSSNAIFSQRLLLQLVNKGLSREDAYKVMQENAMEATRTGETMENLILEDSRVTKVLDAKIIRGCFTLDYYLRNINAIYKRFKL
ncbi:MAG: adenylosuccinate lyase [Elusimicrobiota bacterium]